ncbi:hypothetical protein ABZZ47_36650 [Streptomyces sp. NPDC006465]|uniref:hypothetical protein n=1 Tax=Streptomyces sp. NPDC006465 TaxID=3157174 RepID=UPI0033A1DF59
MSFDLVGEAYEQAGLAPAAVGTLIGAVAYTGGNVWLARRGARHRKRSGHQRATALPSEAEQGGSGTALALSALLDGVPESAVIGVSLLDGCAVSLVTVAAVSISNVPEGIQFGGYEEGRPHQGVRLRYLGGDRRIQHGVGRPRLHGGRFLLPRRDRRHDDPRSV